MEWNIFTPLTDARGKIIAVIIAYGMKLRRYFESWRNDQHAKDQKHEKFVVVGSWFLIGLWNKVNHTQREK